MPRRRTASAASPNRLGGHAASAASPLPRGDQFAQTCIGFSLLSIEPEKLHDGT